MERPIVNTFPRATFWIAVGGLLLLALFYVGSLTAHLSPLNCWHEDVDIYSGRTRYTRYLFWIPVKVHVDETAISLALIEPPHSIPEWHRVNTFSPGIHHSLHYYYHAAINQITHMERIWSLGEFSDDARKESARQLLKRWQNSGTSSADEYVEQLWKAVAQQSDSEL